jgi:hypothetical protein
MVSGSGLEFNFFIRVFSCLFEFFRFEPGFGQKIRGAGRQGQRFDPV